MKFLILPLIALLALPALSQEKYPGWKKGEMDLHFIYTGRGEANFYIFPDGTSMLTDLGDHQATVPMTDPKPDLSRRAGEWVARYILRVNPNGPEVDYCMVSHFHNDHTGCANLDAPMTQGRTPDYKLVGLAEAGEYLRFGHFIDRGFPNYDYPAAIDDEHIRNYRHFADWQKREYGAQQEAFRVGELNQIALLKKPRRYAKTFSIRNLAASGEVWNGPSGGTTRYFDLHPNNLRNTNENTKSIALRIDYGPFSYFTGGDLSCAVLGKDGESINLEARVGEICGEVDVAKCSHHAYKDAMHPDFLRHVRANAYINCVWDQFHTQPEIISRIFEQQPEPLFLSQYIVAQARNQHADTPWMQKTCPHNGHIVVKVFDKGRRYKIYRLSAEDESMTIQHIYGPFRSK